MKTLILDTDFLIMSVKFKVHFIEEIKRICDFNVKICILDKTIEELKGKPGEKLIKTILEKNKIEVIKTSNDKKVDDLILGLVDDNYVVATQDGELKGKLRKKGIKLITIRQKKYLVLR